MKKALAFVTFLLSCAGAIAQTPTDASIDDLLVVSKSDQLVDGMYNNALSGMKQGMERGLKGKQLNAAQQEVMNELPGKVMSALKEEMSWDTMHPLVRQVYKETFTQSEIDGLIAFYKSPAGIAYTNKMPTIFQKSQEIMKPLIPKVVQRMNDLMNEEMSKIQSLASEPPKAK